MTHPVPGKNALWQAVDHIERLQNGRAHAEPLSVARLPHADLAVRMALRSAVARGRLTCIVSETFSPDKAALHMLCAQSCVTLEEMSQRKLEQSDFNRLTCAAAKISLSAIHFASCSDISQTASELLDLARVQDLQTVVCEKRTDADLDDWRVELEFVSKMTGAEIHLLTGRLPAAGRFISGFGQRA
jgi:hypothetical protein